MGWSYEVSAWREVDGKYQDVFVYGGKSIIQAIKALREAKKTCGCVTFKWRG